MNSITFTHTSDNLNDDYHDSHDSAGGSHYCTDDAHEYHYSTDEYHY